jgi:pimeloyl-ACP methyl ester carboxylesterase
VPRKLTLLAAIVALVLIVAPAASGRGNDPARGSSGHNKGFAGLVDIGGGRKIYMECRGKGSPTVVFVSGAGDRTETWNKTLDPSEPAVLPAISETNRVCAYDRPGTYLVDGEGEEDFHPSRSDPAPQPTTLQDAVDDLHALLGASGERGPYVLVGHSMGGAISKLYASEYPRDVSGLVLIDYTPYEARRALTDEQWGYWKVLLGNPPKEAIDLYKAVERFDHQRNLGQALAAASLKPMPLIVLSSDEPYDLLPYVENGTLPLTADQAERFGKLLFRSILEARANLVGQVPGARHITDTHSGHYIHQEQPELVIDSVREVVEAARKKACALGVKNHGQCVKAEKHAQLKPERRGTKGSQGL